MWTVVDETKVRHCTTSSLDVALELAARLRRRGIRCIVMLF